LTESKNIINFELEQSLFEALKENLREDIKQKSVQIPFEKEEIDDSDRERIIKRWKESEGYYYLNPGKFLFSLKNL